MSLMDNEDHVQNLEPGLGVPLYKSLLCAFVVLVPFQDSSLLRTPAASSLSIVPLTLLSLLHGRRWIFQRAPYLNRSLLLLGGYLAIITLFHISMVQHGPTAVPWLALLRYCFLCALLFFAALKLDYDTVLELPALVYIMFAITVLGILIDTIFGLQATSILHSTSFLADRPRGFSTESSTLSIQVVVSGMLTAHFVTGRWKRLLIALFTALLMVYSGSKGGLIALLLCGLILLIAKSGSSVASKILLWCTLVPLMYVVALVAVSRFTTIVEANETSTIATRLSMTVYAVITVLHHPLGVGFIGFLPSIPRYLPDAMHLVQSWFPFPLWFYEVRNYLYPPYAEADCKTFFFDFFVFFGIPFAILFLIFAYKLLKGLLKLKLYWLFVGTLFCFIALMTYYSSLNAYAVPLLFGVSLNEIRRNQNPLRLH